MMRVLSKLFNVRASEWPRLAVLYLMIFFVILGAAWGETLIASAFLEQVGITALPWFYMVRALLSIPAVALYTYFAERISNRRMLITIMAIGIAGVLVGLGILNAGAAYLAYPLMYLLVYIPLTDIFSPHWDTYVNSFYDVRAAKRIIPVLGTAEGVATILGGLSMNLITDAFSPTSIILLWLGTVAIMPLLAWLMPHLIKGKPATQVDSYGLQPQQRQPEKAKLAYLRELREGYNYVANSRFLRWIAVSTFLLIILLTFVSYQVSEIFLAELQTTQAIADFSGWVMGLSNLIMLPAQLFLLSRIIGWLGVGNAALIFPAGNLLFCGGLIFAPGLPTAALNFFGNTVFYGKIGAQVDSLFYNAVPLRAKARARAFILGLLGPIATLIASVLLLRPFVSIPWFLPMATGVLAVLYLISMLVIRRQYSQALVEMLEQEDYSFLLSQNASDLAMTDMAALKGLRAKLEGSTSHEMTIFMVKLIAQIRRPETVPILRDAAAKASAARTRAAILDIVAAADLSGEGVYQLYSDFLEDSEGQVRVAAIAGLETLSERESNGQRFTAQMLPMVQDSSLDVRARVLYALASRDNFYELEPAVAALEELLASPSAGERTAGVHVLGEIGNRRAIDRLLDYLNDPEDEVRLAAALAVEALAADVLMRRVDGGRLEEVATPLLADSVERVRQAALVMLGQVGTRSAHNAMIKALADHSSTVRARAVEELADVGKVAIPLVHPLLDASDSQMRKMAAVTLSRINPREFGPIIIGTHLTGNLLSIYKNYGLIEALEPAATFSGIALLRDGLREQSQRLGDEIFYLLSAIYDAADVKVIRDALLSDHPRARINATEALEALTSPKTAGLIAPLFETDLPVENLLEISRENWDMEMPQADEALHTLVREVQDPWLRAMAVYAVGELGATLKPQTPPTPRQEEAEEKSRSPRDRRKAGGGGLDALWGALEDDEPAEKEAEAPAPRRERITRGSLFAALGGDDEPEPEPEPEAPVDGADIEASAVAVPLEWTEIEALVAGALQDRSQEVRTAAQAAQRQLSPSAPDDSRTARANLPSKEEMTMLSIIERIIFLKEVPFFQAMTIDQLKILASVCEEELFEEDTRIFNTDDPGGVLYVVVNGRVGIEREKRAGSYARLATVGAHSYFGEMDFFDDRPRSTSAIAIQDTLVLRLRREPLIALARQHPEMSLALINVLSQRLREANERIADLTRSRPSQLNKLFDQYQL